MASIAHESGAIDVENSLANASISSEGFNTLLATNNKNEIQIND